MRNLPRTTPSIYVITAITKIYPRHPEDINDWLREKEEYRSPAHLGQCRCMGWFPTLEKAEIALQQHAPHLHKDFEWIVIEETISTFYAEVMSRTCYHWDTKSHAYVKTTEPECLHDYPNLGLG